MGGFSAIRTTGQSELSQWDSPGHESPGQRDNNPIDRVVLVPMTHAIS